jgi:hypothetical protein
VIGVFKASSLFKRLGDATIGLRNSDGKVPDPGVAKEEAALNLTNVKVTVTPSNWGLTKVNAVDK